jgi:hypothetical protein
MVVDQTAASREYCFKSGLGTMVHFAAQPDRASGLEPARLKQLPELGRMTPGVWYFLSKGHLDPHHAHAMAGPTIAIAV